ncbi:hypothetical protein JS531_06300 [Bifidobacterium sp. CP2]|uniref:hypothetical protein n=1 Tax=Bifidobacterium sp. CP2 TaxID=2809025 RepID=UPI001BDC99BF|nr:hypothetical protein [Bifidobacterium sp. CP2]MBT1181578.1 hypothetical protein [Bifidobacterium sp. CP2]
MNTNHVIKRVMLRTVPLIMLCGALLATGYLMSSHHEPTSHVIQADYPQYATLSESVQAADVIIVGTVLESREELSYPHIDTTNGDAATNPQYGLVRQAINKGALAVPVTVTDVRVLEVLKGAVTPNEVIAITQVGGHIDGQEVREEHTVLLNETDHNEFLLLLHTYNDESYDAINPQDGVLAVDDHGTVSRLSSVPIQGASIGLTLDDYRKEVQKAAS